MSPGRLLIGATPLGQPADASARLVSALARSDVIAAEDTRRIRTLAQALEVKLAGKVVSLYDQNEATGSRRWSPRSRPERPSCW